MSYENFSDLRVNRIPSWFKEGAYVWLICALDYDQIYAIDTHHRTFECRKYGTFDFDEILEENINAARLRPFTADELKNTLGEIIIDHDNALHIITDYSVEDGRPVVWFAGGRKNCSAEQLREFRFISGKLCGVLERMDWKGEWRS